MEIIEVTLFCLTACILLKILSAGGGEIKLVCTILAACIVTLKFLDGFSSISDSLNELFEQTGLDDKYLSIIFKSLGICYVTQLGCDCCRDSGETALASQLELVGKAALLLVSLPLFSTAAEIVKELLY